MSSARHEHGERRAPDSPLMDLQETASYLGLSEAQVLQLVREKKLYPVKCGPLFDLEVTASWKAKNMTHVVTETPPSDEE